MFGDIIEPTHLLLILVVALLVLGPKRLPEVGRSLGNGIRDFRTAMAGVQNEAKSLMDEPAVAPAQVVTEAAAPVVTATTASTEPDPADYAD